MTVQLVVDTPTLSPLRQQAPDYTGLTLQQQVLRQRQQLILVLVLGVIGLLVVLYGGHAQQQQLAKVKQNSRQLASDLHRLQDWQDRYPALDADERRTLATPLTQSMVRKALTELRQDPQFGKLRIQLSDPQAGVARVPLAGQSSLNLVAQPIELHLQTSDDQLARQLLARLANRLPGQILPLKLEQKIHESGKNKGMIDSHWQLLAIGLADALPAWPTNLPPASTDAEADPLQDRPLLAPAAPALNLPIPAEGATPPTPIPPQLQLNAILYLDAAHWSFWLNGQKYTSGQENLMIGGWQVVTVSADAVMLKQEGSGQLQQLRLMDSAPLATTQRLPQGEAGAASPPSLLPPPPPLADPLPNASLTPTTKKPPTKK